MQLEQRICWTGTSRVRISLRLGCKCSYHNCCYWFKRFIFGLLLLNLVGLMVLLLCFYSLLLLITSYLE
uniref:Putative ovule protein n=1 Tax=Solanum chacoense TaxID=4108 RepID=A0A0V0IVT0_SOLCH